MSKLFVAVVLALFVCSVAAEDSFTLFNANIAHPVAGPLNLGLEFYIFDNAEVNNVRLTFGGVHSCAGCQFSAVEFWSGDYTLHYSDLERPTNHQNSLIFAAPLVGDFASPVTETLNGDYSAFLSRLIVPDVYIVIVGQGVAPGNHDFIGPIVPVINYVLGSDFTFEGDHLQSSPRGKNIVSETFVATTSISTNGWFKYEITLNNRDLNGKFQDNVVFTPETFAIKMGDSNVDDADGVVLIEAIWVPESDRVPYKTSGSVFLSRGQERVLSQGTVYAIIAGSDGDNLRGPVTKFTNNGEPTFTGKY